jgi:hypothetical protein
MLLLISARVLFLAPVAAGFAYTQTERDIVSAHGGRETNEREGESDRESEGGER